MNLNNSIFFEVRSENMFDGSSNSYLEGDKLICNEIEVNKCESIFQNGKDKFVIMHNTKGVLIGQIINHTTITGEITVHSLNPKYKDHVFNLNDIDKLYSIVRFQRDGRTREC